MQLLGKGILDKFSRSHADIRTSLAAWQKEVEAATWQTPAEVKMRYPDVSILPDMRHVFNIKGNSYRLDVKVSYKQQIVRVVRIGTHTEYDKWTF